MDKLLMTAALAAVLAMPMMASAEQSYHRGYRAQAQAPYGTGVTDAARMTPARVRALQECSTLEQKWPQSSFGAQQLEVYRACMAEHGQAE